jgi:hypothetical protein
MHTQLDDEVGGCVCGGGGGWHARTHITPWALHMNCELRAMATAAGNQQQLVAYPADCGFMTASQVLTTDDEDDSPRGLQMARIGGRKQKLDTAGSSDEEGGAPRQQRMTKAAGERGSVQSQLGKSGGAGGRASVAGEADWAEFPDPVQVMVAQASAGDDSWAQFDAVPQPTISEEPQAAEEAASPAEQPAADPAEQGTRDLPDQEAPVALPGSATQDDSVPAPDK